MTEPGNDKIPLYLLIGCTAGGKSRVGFELARRVGGDIISVDSMKIYQRMDIGTAKPSVEARGEVPHHMIDVVEPSEGFSLARYLEGADTAIRAIHARGKPPIAVGGTMLYVQGLRTGVFEGPGGDPAFRRQLRDRAEREGVPALHEALRGIDPEAASRIHPNDLRRIERALEVHHVTGRPISELQTQWSQPESPYDCRVAALRRPREEANRRINARVRRMVDEGLVDEVRRLLDEPAGIGDQAAQAVGYAELIAHFQGRVSLDDAIEQIKINSRRLGKHQRTWMRRMQGITWIDVADDDDVKTVADRVQKVWGL